jgi:hypothetical protein
MRADKNKNRYFRGDEIGAKLEPATTAPVASTKAPITVPTTSAEMGLAPPPSESAHSKQ